MSGRRLRLVAGVDEAGRGPLAGPVYAAAVILDPRRTPDGLADSKVLRAEVREQLVLEIERHAVCHAVGVATTVEIDRLNILHAAMLAMRRAVAALCPVPESVLIDGNRCPDGLPCPSRAVIGGDGAVPEISAASILAKVARDREMQRLDELHPGYGFAQHKGYATEKHLIALRQLGPCIEHRRSFAPVRLLLDAASAQAGPSQERD